jgi:hypothetical protein
MKLTDLNPRWIGTGGEGVTRNGEPVPYQHGVAIVFDCPSGCGTKCCIPFTPTLDGGPPLREDHLWQREGDDFATLTLTPSIQRMDGCKWHGWIRNGEVVNA